MEEDGICSVKLSSQCTVSVSISLEISAIYCFVLMYQLFVKVKFIICRTFSEVDSEIHSRGLGNNNNHHHYFLNNHNNYTHNNNITTVICAFFSAMRSTFRPIASNADL